MATFTNLGMTVTNQTSLNLHYGIFCFQSARSLMTFRLLHSTVKIKM
jgi:hypothetical protein